MSVKPVEFPIGMLRASLISLGNGNVAETGIEVWDGEMWRDIGECFPFVTSKMINQGLDKTGNVKPQEPAVP